ncbi:6-pyruvoyl-tetrahydropterin synthase-related protein [Clostridium felsineum]|uniref:6-pyruvoyl-tetrahydropterin synthase-related protein n=1 Tax=Clostridium felsineum TaxID=36839 RepID=UPI00098C3E2F|nr:6-pyruvoyl-tetrahydropterin synthase-related protein [Clostridium felsineum]URZ17217.1 hypothetical protein CLFE_032690 [Clostridium felsineum DSM 794]
MEFEGYIYKFKLNASHSVLINNKRGTVHAHTFIISLRVKVYYDTFLLYNKMERVVEDYLKRYEEKELNKVEPFNKIEPTLENIGNVLFEEFTKVFDKKKVQLIKLEISETPSRVYVVNSYSKKDKKRHENKVKKVILDGILTLCTEELIKGFKEHEREEKVVEEEVREKEIEIEEVRAHRKVNNDITKKYSVKKRVVISVICIIFSAVALLYYLWNVGGYPWGIDTYGHIFKGEFLYKNLRQGNLYPLFTKYWYNGVQPFRYWAPLSYYVFSVCEFLMSGNTLNAYLIFIILLFLIGALGWLIWGIREKCVFTALVLGILWFFLPENLKVLFYEGNIPRAVITVLLPYLFYFLWDFVEYDKKWSILPMTLFMTLITFTHLMISAMVGVASFMFLFIYSIIFKKILKPIQCIIAMFMGIAICGVWLYPALKGGLTSMNSDATSEVMKFFSAKFAVALNPFIRLTPDGKNGMFYYGLSIFLVALFGIVLSKKKSLPGFITSVIILLASTTAFLPIVSKLPLNQLFWMIRFAPIAYALFIISFLNWKSLKKYIKITVIIIIIADSMLSFRFSLYPEGRNLDSEKVLSKAKDITQQRISLLDDSTFASYASYYICNGENKSTYSYGWAWQGAATANNIVLLNTAMENGYYKYMFDRSMEMGCDTVVLRKSVLKKGKDNFKDIVYAAGLLGYKLYFQNDDSYIFHLNTPKAFGVITEYEGLCIGKSSESLPLLYPDFRKGSSDNIEDYSLKELMKYKVIYLSGFSYNLRAEAEKMITKLSENGVKVIIDMNRIPADNITNRMIFLGVTSEPITFNNRMPNLFFDKEKYEEKVVFKEEYKKWNTVYLEKLPEIQGFSWVKDKKLAFLGTGTKKNKNVYFLGFNLLFNGMTNEDHKSIDIMSRIIGKSFLNTPKREIVPIDISYGKNSIRINSPKNNVNTTLAYLDAYKGDKKIYKDQNLLNVDKKGVTNILIDYPYLRKGIAVSLMGIIGFIILISFVFKGKGEGIEKNT